MRMRADQLFPPLGGAPTRRPIDVRAPTEVARGAIPGALSLPLLDDEERHAVGVRYAEAGQAEAVDEGRRRTEADLPRRASLWRAAAAERPSAVFCWRGGMRSELAQRLTRHPDTPRVEGGYKAMRAHLVASLPPSLARRTAWVVTGPTGSGKTELLRAAAGLPGLLALDLEEAAEHRGSAFGSTGSQPAQATFEHRLMLTLLLGDQPRLLLEDESRNVGRVHLPEPLHGVVRSAPLLVLEESLEGRVRRIHREYALAPARRVGREATRDGLVGAVRRLRRRLGAEPTERMAEALDDAYAQNAWEDVEAFRPVIEPLLRGYYDPLYRKATPTEGRRVAARGPEEELLRWLKEPTPVSPV